jgi:hypothetical protein
MSMHCPCGCSRTVRGVVKSGAAVAYRDVQRTLVALTGVDLDRTGSGDDGSPMSSSDWTDGRNVLAGHVATGTVLERYLADHLHGLAAARRSPGLSSLDREVEAWKLATAPYLARWMDGRANAC